MGGFAIEPELQEEFAAVAESVGCELLHLRFQGNTLQVFLDKPEGGVTHEHCKEVSKQLSALLDVTDFGSGKYLLEVSSPGLERELFGPRDYQRFLGSLVKVTFSNAETGAKQTSIGRLESYQPGATNEDTLVVAENDSTKQHVIGLQNLHKIRLEIEL